MQLTGESANQWAHEQYATVRCQGCGESMTRTMKVIVKMLEVDGFQSCSNPCREQVEQEWFEVLMYFSGSIH
jgi:hypothetical protein